MLLKQLVQTIPSASVEGPVDRDVTGITYDSRRVTPGMLFVAIGVLAWDRHEQHARGDPARIVGEAGDFAIERAFHGGGRQHLNQVS